MICVCIVRIEADLRDIMKQAFGAPGIEPRWTASTKEGVGTAYHTSSRVWFTLSHGIINEVYYPTIDTPNTRDVQLLITDGESFLHEERRHLKHKVEYPHKNSLCYRLTNKAPEKRYTIVKEVISDPHQPVLLTRIRLKINDKSLIGKLKLYLLVASHMRGSGSGDSAAVSQAGGKKILHAWQDDFHLTVASNTDFAKRSVGYVGTSDGYQDLLQNFQMDWEFEQVLDGNVAMMAEVILDENGEATIALGFGDSQARAATCTFQALSKPFDIRKERFVKQWQRAHKQENATVKLAYKLTSDKGSLYRLSRAILLAHEDKMHQGALVASMSIPWGEVNDDSNSGGYHLVWPRDLFHSTMALLASGQLETPRRSLIYLACVQREDGNIPQNCWLDGTAYWEGLQLDEVAVPILLAWHLRKFNTLGDFDPWEVIQRAVRFLMLHGPVTGQERWEENSGYSPSTLAAVIAALIAAADFADDQCDSDSAQAVRDYADWLSSHLEDWMVTTEGSLVESVPKHYIRINPASPGQCSVPNPNHSVIDIGNGGGRHLAKEIVGGDFLCLVRYGVRPADDPVVVESLKVYDAELKYKFDGGPCWRRYNYDGYGQKRNGEAFDGTGYGGCWPIFTGERGMYELAAGNIKEAKRLIKTMESFANTGGMLPEQIWHHEDIPEKGMYYGKPAGSAMPLCWSHAEYINLCQSVAQGAPLDRVDSAYQRYVVEGKRDCAAEIWTKQHPTCEVKAGCVLRIVLAEYEAVRWTTDNWETSELLELKENAFKVFQGDIQMPNNAGDLLLEVGMQQHMIKLS